MDRTDLLRFLKDLVDPDPGVTVVKPAGITAKIDGEDGEYPALVVRLADGQTFILDIEESDED